VDAYAIVAEVIAAIEPSEKSSGKHLEVLEVSRQATPQLMSLLVLSPPAPA
jgi:hypothetical protein